VETAPTVGLFTSPHIHTFRERITVDGEPISENEVTEILERIWAEADALGEPLTRFETLTVLALEHFRRRGVDYAVLETGLGGRNDSTNAVSSSLLAVVTSLALDHTHILGNSLEAIAAEKAGIIRTGQAAAVLGPSIRPLDSIFRARAREQCVPVFIGGQGDLMLAR